MDETSDAVFNYSLQMYWRVAHERLELAKSLLDPETTKTTLELIEKESKEKEAAELSQRENR